MTATTFNEATALLLSSHDAGGGEGDTTMDKYGRRGGMIRGRGGIEHYVCNRWLWILCLMGMGVSIVVTVGVGNLTYFGAEEEPSRATSLPFNDMNNSRRIVRFDGRSLFVHDERVLLLGGSLHPFRATPSTWERVLDDMQAASLNLVTIYVMWSVHQPFATSPFDGSFPTTFDGNTVGALNDTTLPAWTLADAIRSAGERNMYVHVRLGPYICAEASYGGIPEWVPLLSDRIALRRPSLPWMRAMGKYLRKVISYLQENQLFIHQGGPIILGQVENELGPASESEDRTDWAKIDSKGNFVEPNDSRGVRTANVQDYADWAGALVQQLEPNIVWTMCFGISANSTILTYNGFLETPSWLENHGGGRIQVDQPAMWSEDEGGFQLWGEDPRHPADYQWGVTAKQQAYTALRWFARGGTHLNFYMWWGGYNRGRVAAAAITNMYANEAPVCPSGEPRQPKYDHLSRLLGVIQEIAQVLLEAPTALGHSQSLFVQTDEGRWVRDEKVKLFNYNASTTSGINEHKLSTTVLFVENNRNQQQKVGIPGLSDETTVMAPFSASVFVNGRLRFDSAAIADTAQQYQRRIDSKVTFLQDCISWSETMPADAEADGSSTAVEQTILNVMANVSSDYARYSTSFEVNESYDAVDLLITTQTSNAFTVFLDQRFAGQVENHTRQEQGGGVELLVSIGPLSKGTMHRLVLLSESLGYSNLLGRWGGGTGAKEKGIIGDVVLVLPDGTRKTLNSWTSLPGLKRDNQLEALSNFARSTKIVSDETSPGAIIGQWTKCRFRTPDVSRETQQLYIEVTRGRGHLWLNGFDLGRFWNITQDGSANYAQSYYSLPWDYMSLANTTNELLQFDSLPDSDTDDRLASCKLSLSWLEHSNSGRFRDEVGATEACLH